MRLCQNVLGDGFQSVGIELKIAKSNNLTEAPCGGSILKLLMKTVGLRRGEWSDPMRTPDHLFEPTIPATLRFLEAHGFDVVSYYTYSRSDETSAKLLNRLYRRRLLLGSNSRFYARVRSASH